MRWLWIPVLVTLLASCVSADLVRFDPPDPRLDKKITLEVSDTKLEDVAKSLTEQTGIIVTAGTGTRDWKVREQKVSIQAKNVPLGTALDQIGKLLSYCVSREGKDKEWTYVIWQDKKGRDLEAEMLNSQREEAAQRVVRSRQGTVDLANDALSMSPEEAMKQRDKNPVLAYMGGTKTGRGFSSFLSYFQSNFPTEYDLMLRGKNVYVPLSGLPANMQQATKDMLSGGMATALSDALKNESKGGGVPVLTPYQILFQPASDQSGQEVESLGFGGLTFLTGLGPDGQTYNTQFGGGIPMSAFALTDPDSALGKLIADGLISVEDGKSLDDLNKDLDAKVNNDPNFAETALAHDSPTEKNLPTDPELTREVEIKDILGGKTKASFTNRDSDKYQTKMLAEISRATGYSVLKESLDGETVVLGLFVHPGKQPLYKVLIGIEKAGCIWAKDDGALRMRPSNWALLRSYAIPSSFMAHYKDLLNTKGELTLDDVAGIATGLTDGQIDKTFLRDQDLSFLGNALSGREGNGPRTLLRFYASLTPEQKAGIAVEPGLSFSQLTDQQWDLLSEYVSDQFGGMYVTDGSVFLKPQNETEIKIGSQSRAFEFAVHIQNQKDPKTTAQALYMPGKKQIAEMRDARKKAEEAAKAAEQSKPAQEQPAPPSK